jgi:hypothetical protein
MEVIMLNKYYKFTVALTLMSLCLSAQANLAQDAQNPVANLISVPFQNNFNFGYGPFKKTQYILNVEPVIPVSISKNWNLIFRTIAPIINEPSLTKSGSSRAGLGDINPTVYLTPAGSHLFTWGAGPTVSIPTATAKVLGTGKLSVGPSLVLVAMPSNWVIGTLVYNLWSVAGSPARPRVDEMNIEYFVTLNLPKNWYISTSPIMTADWEASHKNRWTIPVGAGFGRIFELGSQSINASIHGYYNVDRPEFGSRWSLQLGATLLFPE